MHVDFSAFTCNLSNNYLHVMFIFVIEHYRRTSPNLLLLGILMILAIVQAPSYTITSSTIFLNGMYMYNVCIHVYHHSYMHVIILHMYMYHCCVHSWITLNVCIYVSAVLSLGESLCVGRLSLLI